MLGTTIVTRSRLPYAHVLGASFLQHHPAAAFVTLVMDETRESTPGDGPEFLTSGDLQLAPGLWERLAASYEEEDLTAALKPFLLQRLLTLGHDVEAPAQAVVLMDPEMRVEGELTEAFRVATRHGLALVPRVLDEVPDDGDRPAEGDLIQAGLFNDNVLCVGQSAGEFLDRWAKRVETVSWGGRRADQAWLGWAPTRFGAGVIRDAGYGVSYWNLHDRPLSRSGRGALRAGERRLRLLDLSGYDPSTPWLISRDPRAGSRVRPADAPVLAQELERYAGELRAAGRAERAEEYGWANTPDGVRLDPPLRRAYRRASTEAHLADGPAPASPFAAGATGAFAGWLSTPVMGPASLGLGPLERELWQERPDLQGRFPDPAGHDARDYRAWLEADPGAQALRRAVAPLHPSGPAQSAGAVSPTGPSDAARRLGWNVIGGLATDSEVGEAARRMATAFEQAAVMTRRVTLPDASEAMRRPVTPEADMGNSLICVDADQLARAAAFSPGSPAHGQEDPTSGPGRRVGLSFWELSRFPDPTDVLYSELDEIWCPSQFVADAVSTRARVPVKVIPLPASTPVGPTRMTREKLGLPDGFVFYSSYELGPALSRKNPFGLIDAYCRAFAPDDGAILVLRSSDGRHHPHQLAQVRWAARHRPDIRVLDAILDPFARQAMIELTDCFVSLHRAEAFGVGMATAMAAARPVIATAYSGNLDYMDERSAYLVPYALRPVGENNAPYPANAVWAKPDLDAAAGHMREVFRSPDRAAEVGLRAAQRVARTHGLWQSATAIAREVGITLPRKTGPSA